MGWGNLDPNTDSFTTGTILIPYKGGISYQFLQKLAKNTSYNYRRCDQRLFLFNEQFGDGQEKDFDTDFDYGVDHACYVQIIASGSSSSQSLPLDIDVSETEVRYLQLTTSYQALVSGSYFDIKYLATGGIRIKNTRAGATRYLTCSIIELRSV